MKISVAGLWHLGCVTAACMARKGFDVIGYDPDKKVITELQTGKAPLFEPGLDQMLSDSIKEGKLSFSGDPSSVSEADIIWITYDTPVDENDKADISFVEKEISSLFPYAKENAVILISSQLPVGSVAKLEKTFSENYPLGKLAFACSPENLRLGKAIDVFLNPDRIVVGVRNENDKSILASALTGITENIVWMSVESAEMTKHAVNAFLATSVVFINELAVLCEQVNADANEVENGLKTEFRIGPKAYLRPGSAFAGGTLARDISYLIQKEKEFDLSSVFFTSILESNENHKNWVRHKLKAIFGNLENKTIGILGLTYKPGTDTLRRSMAIELCYWLDQHRVKIIAYDPLVKQLSSELSEFINLQESIEDVLLKSDAVVIGTESVEFSCINTEYISSLPKRSYIIDANGFLKKNLKGIDSGYLTIGKSI